MTNIMLVEDDATMRTLLKALLELEGYAIVECDKTSEEEIIALIKLNQPDLILLDVHIRHLNGFDILEKIHSDPSLLSIKVVMTSGMALGDRCLKAGANAFLLKPYMPE